MATHRVSSGDAVEIPDPIIGTTSGSDANSSSEKKNVDFDEKKGSGSVVEESNLPAYADVEGGEDSIHHPADKDDILTHTIHVEDDPTMNALTFRTWFLGMNFLYPTHTFRPAFLLPLGSRTVLHSNTPKILTDLND